MVTITVNDKMVLDARGRRYTNDGYLVASGRLARTGVQYYMAKELGLTDRKPNDLVSIYRPEDEVFADDSLRSFEGAPLTIDHPPGGVNASNWKQKAVGDVRDVSRDDRFMVATLTVRDKDAIKRIETKKAELSNGYTFDLDMTPGITADGESYVGVQRNIRGNHVAIVSSARCGASCKIGDEDLTTAEASAAKVTDAKKESTMKKLVVDGIEVEAEGAAASAIEKLTKERDSARQALAIAPSTFKVLGKDYKPEELVKLATDQAAQIEALEKDAMTPEKRDAMVADWAGLLNDAKQLAPQLTTDGKTCLAIRKELITKLAADARVKPIADALLAGKTVDGLDEANAKSVLAALKAAHNVAPTKPAQDASVIGKTILGGQPATTTTAQDAGDKLHGRDAFMRNQANAFQAQS